jgi:hypothetical protein
MPFLTKGKTNWKYILIVLILAAIVGGVILSYLRYFNKEISFLTKFPEIKKPEKIEIAYWKTYINEDYGFEIKYPPNLTAKDWGPQAPNWKTLVYVGENKKIGDGFFSIGIERKCPTLKEFFRQTCSFPITIQESELENVFIGQGRYSAKKYSYRGGNVPIFDLYLIEYGGYLYQIRYAPPFGISSPETENTFKRILSTLLFLEDSKEPEIAIKAFVRRFYKILEERENAELLMSYFTPPLTPEEKESYKWLTGTDLPEPSPRVFERVKISNPSIKKIEKIEEGKFKVEAEDDFQTWLNVSNEWSTPSRRNVIFIVIRKENKWLIEKYAEIPKDPAKKFRAEKYSGFGHEPIIYDTTNWRTYRNEEYGFEIKYPENYEIKPEKRVLLSILFWKSGKEYTEHGIYFDFGLTDKVSFQESERLQDNLVESWKKRSILAHEEKTFLDQKTILWKISGDIEGFKEMRGLIIHQREDNLILYSSFHTVGEEETFYVLDHMLSTLQFLK